MCNTRTHTLYVTSIDTKDSTSWMNRSLSKMTRGFCGKDHCIKSIHNDSSCSEETTSDPCYSGFVACVSTQVYPKAWNYNGPAGIYFAFGKLIPFLQSIPSLNSGETDLLCGAVVQGPLSFVEQQQQKNLPKIWCKSIITM